MIKLAVLMAMAGEALRVLRRRAAWVVATFLLVTTIIVLHMLSLPRSYTATGTFIVGGSDSIVPVARSYAELSRIGDARDMQSQILVLRSPTSLAKLLEREGVVAALVEDCEVSRTISWSQGLRSTFAAYLPAQPTCAEQMSNRALALQRLTDGFGIDVAGRSRVIYIAFSSSVPRVASRLVDALLETYLADENARRLVARDSALAWLGAEIGRVDEEIRGQSIRVGSFLRDRQMVPGQYASVGREQLSAAVAELVAAQAAQAEADARLQRAGRGGMGREALGNATVVDLRRRQALIDAEVASRTATLGPTHPTVTALVRQQRELEWRVNEQIRLVGDSVRREAVNAAARVAEFSRRVEALRGEVGAGGEDEVTSVRMIRDLEVLKEVSASLLKMRNELQTERWLSSSTLRLVSLAPVPLNPSSPKRTPIMIAGLALAALLAAVAALLRDVADRTVRSIPRLEALSGLEVLGYFPRIRRQGRGMLAALAESEKSPSFQEAVRGLFGRCVLLRSTQPRSLLLAASEAAGNEEKLLAVALARFGASTGRRVLLIDCDFRRPILGTIFGIEAAAGLGDCLRGQLGLGETISNVGPDLDVLTTGRSRTDGPELLGSPRMAELLRLAEDSYALVLLVSSPLAATVDTVFLARSVGEVLCYVRWGRSEMSTALSSLREVTQAGGRVLGLAMGVAREDKVFLFEGSGLPAVPPLLTIGAH